MRSIRSADADTGVVHADAGATVEDAWRAMLPRGWWLPVAPGTMRPTLGGAVAMNVHGKNHFAAGGFGEHVLALEVATTDGRVVEVAPGHPDFRAFTGGMGLLGLVTGVRLKMKRVHSGRLAVEGVECPSLGGMIADMERRAPDADYLVGWVDAFHPAGRGILHAARNLGPGEDPDAAGSFGNGVQELPPRIAGVVPRALASAALGPFASPAGMRWMNRVRYGISWLRGAHAFRDAHVRFTFLLDFVPGWERLYDPGGFIQHQVFVPKARAAELLLSNLARCRAAGIVPWLGVLKKHRDCPSLLAHALDGYSLALDFPVTAANREGLWRLCAEMDEAVADAGGRCYFAKDLTARPEFVARCYPGIPAFREAKRRWDSAGVLTSDLAVRLRIV
ncbi:MAG: Decaprenylphosphoryl-beta-D-ribose oxidase [Planctomycetes bacterium]|nr:Decaprenylphosphoryl-beta-D-ribose oxidase [Planctomycetota bacterium]